MFTFYVTVASHAIATVAMYMFHTFSSFSTTPHYIAYCNASGSSPSDWQKHWQRHCTCGFSGQTDSHNVDSVSAQYAMLSFSAPCICQPGLTISQHIFLKTMPEKNIPIVCASLVVIVLNRDQFTDDDDDDDRKSLNQHRTPLAIKPAIAGKMKVKLLWPFAGYRVRWVNSSASVTTQLRSSIVGRIYGIFIY